MHNDNYSAPLSIAPQQKVCEDKSYLYIWFLEAFSF